MKKFKKPQIKKNEWIPAEQGLPREFEHVLVQYENGLITEDWIFNNEFSNKFRIFAKEIIAWRRYPCVRAKKLRRKQENGTWIDPDKKKPRLLSRVMVQYEDGGISIARLYDHGFELEGLKGKALYWMPLPEPYIPKQNGGIENEEN